MFPLRQRFPFPAFPQTLHPASQAATTSSYTFLPDITDRKGDASLPTQHRSKYPCTAPTVANFCRGSPNNTLIRFISAYPARENFGTQKPLRFVDVQLAKTAKLPSFVHPNSQFEVVAHSERLSTRRNLPQTTVPAVTQSQTSTNQHMKRLARVFSTTSTSARNHFRHRMREKKSPE